MKNKYIICDIDGTVATHEHRGHYDYSKVIDDKPKPAVIALVRLLLANGYAVVFVSGREETCAGATATWIEKNVIKESGSYQLFMRSEGDRRSDDIVKKELFLSSIEPERGLPEFVLDDRDRVVKMWRELGLTCLQVAEGNF